MKTRFIAVMNGVLYLIWLDIGDHLFTLAIRRVPAVDPTSSSTDEDEGEFIATMEEDYLRGHRFLHIKNDLVRADISIFSGEGDALGKAMEEVFIHAANALLDYAAEILRNARTVVV